MSPKKKGRGAKVVTAPQHKSRKESANLSAIEIESFLEGLQQNSGNPLHSTAVEEDLNAIEEEQVDGGKAGRKKVPPTSKKATDKQRGAAVKRKEREREGEKEEEEKKRSRRSTTGPSAARPVKMEQTKKSKKKKSESGSGPEESDAEPVPQSRKEVLLSSEEDEADEDGSWCPSPEMARVNRLGRIKKSSTETSKARKSSSGSTSADPEKSSSGEQRRKRHGGDGGTESEVVLDAFLNFCDQYRESVESTAIKHTVDTFSSNVEKQLLEQISSSKELKVLKRKNAKVGSLIRKKTGRLLDAKQELMRTERNVWLLQKERAELEVRLADLRQGQAFLQDIRELNRQYLDYRHKHRKEKETYEASSLPALLLETKYCHQLRGTNKQPKKPQKKTQK